MSKVLIAGGYQAYSLALIAVLKESGIVAMDGQSQEKEFTIRDLSAPPELTFKPAKIKNHGPIRHHKKGRARRHGR